MRRIVLILLYLTFTISINAQQIGLRNFSTIDAGSGKQNWDIDQDKAGRMLFANNNGLLVFDGSQWMTYPVSNNTIARSVKYDPKRKIIYVGASNEFGYFKYSPKLRTLEYHSLIPLVNKKYRNFGEIWNIELQGDKVCFKSKSQAFTCKNNLTGITVTTIVEPYTKWKGAEMLKGKTVRSVLKLGSDYIIATAQHGLYRYDGAEIRPYALSITPYLQKNEVFCAATNGTALAFGTVRGGMVAIDLKTGNTYYANNLTNLQDNTVLAIGFDKTQNIWLGLDNGVSYVTPYTPYTLLFNTPQTSIGTGYTSLLSNGRLYLGTNQGLFYTQFPFISSPLPVEKTPVSGIAGQIWALSNVGGTVLCAADKGAYIIRGAQASQINGLDGTWTFCELKKHPGYVLASDYRGFVVLKRQGDGYTFYCRPNGFNESSGNVIEDSDGTLWVSNWQEGVYHFALASDLRSARVLEAFNKNNCLVMNENNNVTKIDGKVYISCVDGLYRYDKVTRKVVLDKKMSHVFNTFGIALKIEQTPRGDLWATKQMFMAFARKQANGTWKADSVTYFCVGRQLQIGLGTTGMISPTQTVFNCNTGFMLIDTNTKQSKVTNKLIISSIVTAGSDEKLVYAYNYGTDNEPVTLSHSERDIRINYVLPEYREEKDVIYSVYMEGYDKEWSNFNFNSYKDYKLGHGTYVFHVKAKNLVTGKTEETQIEIDVEPAWYESWYAIILYLIIIGLVIRYSMKLMQKRAERELVRVKNENEQKMTMIKNEQLETELKHRSCELADSTMNLVHKNDILQQLDGKMNDLSESVRREDPKAKITKAINDIRHEIQASMNDEGNWDKFEENFNLVYDNFMQVLRERFPNLNKTDLKLCAYLRMGLSSKEMVSLLNISVRSIETARYRLRKKLNLNAGENLTDFLQQMGKKD